MPQIIGIVELIYYGFYAAAAYTALTIVATAAAMYAMGRILAPKMNLGSLRNQAMQINVRDAAATRPIIYGQRKVSGVLYPIGVSGANSEYLHNLLLIAGHECEELGDVYFGTDIVPLDGSGNATGKYAGFAIVKKHLGTYNQGVDTTAQGALGDTYWTDDHRLQGIAYLYVQLKLSQDLFPGGVPELYCMVKGRKCYDHRDGAQVAATYSTWKWTQNAAVCQADWLRGVPMLNGAGTLIRPYGLGVTDTEINFASVDEAANICDESVTLADASTESRYTANGMIASAVSASQGIDLFRTAMAGDCVYIGGEWYVRAGAYRTPTVTLTDSDLRGPLGSVTIKPSRADLINGVKGVYLSAENNWMPADFPALTNATYTTEDGGDRLWRDIELQLTTSSATAQRLAKIILEDSRQCISFTAKCKLTAFQVQVTDTVMVTNTRFGWASKPFRVVGFSLASESDANGNASLGVDLMLRETASAIYTWSAEETTVDPAPNTLLPDVFTVPAAAGLAVLSDSTTSFVQQDGVSGPRLKVTWTAPADAAVLQGGKTWIEYKDTADATWLIWGSVGGDIVEDYITDVKGTTGYDVRVRHENAFGVRGDYAEVDETIADAESIIEDRSSLCYNGRFSMGNNGWPNRDTFVIESTAGEIGWGARNTHSALCAIRNGMKVACSPGDVFIARGRVYGAAAGSIALIVYFYDTSGTEIAYYVPSNYADSGGWSWASVRVTAPENSSYCYAAAFSSTSGDKVDSVTLYRVVQGSECAAPSLSPAGQQFTTSITITASSADAGATIRLTTDGSPVTPASGVFPGGGLSLTKTATVRVRAYVGASSSAEVIQTYTVSVTTATCATPSLSWTGTRGRGTITVTAVCATSGSALHYYLNGAGPSSYTTPVAVTLTSDIEVYASKTAWNDSQSAYLENQMLTDGGGIQP